MNKYSQTITLGVIATIAGFYLAGAFNSIASFMVSLTASLIVVAITTRIVDASRNAITTYICATSILFLVCWVIVFLLPMGLDENLNRIPFGIPDSCAVERRLYLNMFFVMIAPTLLTIKLSFDE